MNHKQTTQLTETNRQSQRNLNPAEFRSSLWNKLC